MAMVVGISGCPPTSLYLAHALVYRFVFLRAATYLTHLLTCHPPGKRDRRELAAKEEDYYRLTVKIPIIADVDYDPASNEVMALLPEAEHESVQFFRNTFLLSRPYKPYFVSPISSSSNNLPI